jgi:predicted ArsR family transcriptional regulator
MATTRVRQKIIETLERRGTASAAQIGQALNMSATAVRHHLSILAADGRLEAAGERTRAKRGRPEKMYRLSDKVLGENLAQLSDIVLSRWLEALPAAEREAAIAAIAGQMADEAARTDAKLPAARRLVQLVERLNRLHYQARWEAGASGPHVLFGHCPYGAIIDKHPELCAMDAAFLEAMMDAPLEQLSKISNKAGGATHCVFAMFAGAKR